MHFPKMLLTDFYKVNHYEQYPPGTNLVFSNFTPRTSRIMGVEHSVFFGLTYFLKHYISMIQDDLKHTENCDECSEEYGAPTPYQQFLHETLGVMKAWPHINQLNKLGYLPIAIYALPELSNVPMKVPALVIYNTHPDFYWLPNMLETLLSCTLWQGCTSATLAQEYRKILQKYAEKTSDNPSFIDYQAHDFSFRGMSSLESAIISGMAHLRYFKGTDTIPAINAMAKYYDKPLSCGTSVPATEHSVMCAGGQENEFETYRRLICDTYQSGILSIVSDTWDLWNVVDNILPALKNEIMARDGKIVIRPDSGEPVKIICGEVTAPQSVEEYLAAWKRPSLTGALAYKTVPTSSQEKGLIESLWDIFGGTINSKGYKELDPHIGAIYGDSITLERCEAICAQLEAKGFASTNIVFGIGSYTYQYNTRDTLGWAMKATYAEINGKGVDLFKDPKTDDGTKKSAKGLLKVVKKGGEFELQQGVTWEQFHEDDNELKLVFKDGSILI